MPGPVDKDKSTVEKTKGVVIKLSTWSSHGLKD